jgi:hypothetical protein
MSCCGSRRAALRQTTSPPSFRSSSLEFEYTGTGELQVVGPMTGTVYTFKGPGARAAVQAADAPAVAMNQMVRPLR